MDAARWDRIKSIFGSALEQLPDDRAAFLLGACGTDQELRASVERLLRAHAGAGVFLDQPRLQPDASAGPTDAAEPARPPDRIGAYRVTRELGHGGMGKVYLAERDEPGLRRTVAIKVLPPGLSSQFILRRFHKERQILASLEPSRDRALLRRWDDGGGPPLLRDGVRQRPESAGLLRRPPALDCRARRAVSPRLPGGPVRSSEPRRSSRSEALEYPGDARRGPQAPRLRDREDSQPAACGRDRRRDRCS